MDCRSLPLTYTFSDPSIFKLVEDSSKYKTSASVNVQVWTGQDKQFLHACASQSRHHRRHNGGASKKKAMAAKFVWIIMSRIASHEMNAYWLVLPPTLLSLFFLSALQQKRAQSRLSYLLNNIHQHSVDLSI